MWQEDEVNQKLDVVMRRAFNDVYTTSANITRTHARLPTFWLLAESPKPLWCVASSPDGVTRRVMRVSLPFQKKMLRCAE